MLLKMIYVLLCKSLLSANVTTNVIFEQAGQQPTVRSEVPRVAENFIFKGNEEPTFTSRPRTEPRQAGSGKPGGFDHHCPEPCSFSLMFKSCP